MTINTNIDHSNQEDKQNLENKQNLEDNIFSHFEQLRQLSQQKILYQRTYNQNTLQEVSNSIAKALQMSIYSKE
jgi:hypothetical protein